MARTIQGTDGNPVICPAPKTQDPFTAGWEAAMELTYHEWGPEPPRTPELAKTRWEQTCDEGHLTLVIQSSHRGLRCPACIRLLKQHAGKTP
jgi:hypothetical protein